MKPAVNSTSNKSFKIAGQKNCPAWTPQKARGAI